MLGKLAGAIIGQVWLIEMVSIKTYMLQAQNSKGYRFDIKKIIDIFDKKIKGIDNELSQGLDQVGISYNRLIQTLKQRIA